MTQQELIKGIAAATGLAASNVKSVFEAFAETTVNVFTENKEDRVPLPGIGTLKIRQTKERKGRNPKTGEEIVIAANNRPVIAAYKNCDLYKAVN